MQGIEGIADFMGQTAGQQSQGVHPLGLHRLGGGPTCLGRIVEHQHDAGASRSRAVQGADMQADEPGPRVFHLEFGAEHAVAAGLIEAGNVRPIQIRQVARDRLFLGGLRRDAQHAGGHEVEVHHASLFVGDDDARVDGVEEALEELAFLGQPLDDALETAGIVASETPQSLVQEAGFDPVASVQSHRFCRK